MNIPFLNKFALKSKIIEPKAETDTRPIRSGGGRSDNIVLQIAKAFKDRSRKDIQSWRMALAAADAAERPLFTRYADLVDDLKTDGTFKTAVMLRRTTTLSTGFQVRNRKTGNLNEAASELLQQKWFYDYLGKNIDAIIYGTRVIEFLDFNAQKINFCVLPPRNTVPTLKKLIPDLSKSKTIDYDAPEHQAWVIELNPEDPFGVINDIIPNLIWKRNVAQSWAEFCEKFGMPLISATTTNNNTKNIDQIEKQLLALAEASVGVFPEGTTIKFDEANRTDAYNVYQKFIDQNSSEISSVIVGSNTLSRDASNRAQTQVHEDSLDYKISQSDRRNIQFTINDKLFPLLRMQGYNFFGQDDVFEWNEAKEELALDDYWTIVRGVMEEHEVDQDWLSKTFSIPITGKKKNSPVTHLPKAWRKPTYMNACGHHHQPVAMASNRILNTLTALLIQKLWDKEDTSSVWANLIVTEGLELFKALSEGYGITTAYDTPDTLALQLMEYNLFEFSTSKTEARLAATSDLLINKETLQIRSFSDFKSLAEEKLSNFNNEWLQSEYNLSVAVGQNSAAFHRFMSEKDTVTPFVQYQTAGDDLVRPAHEVLDEKIFNLNDPEAMKIWPPNGYGCRCEMLQYNRTPQPGQVTSGKDALNLIKSTDKRFADSQFEINRGDLKQVFTQKQFYKDIKGLPEKLDTLSFDKYGLEPWSKFKSQLKPLKIDRSITPENVKELFKALPEKDFMGFQDYLNRKMMLTKKNFDAHTTGKYLGEREIRHQIFPHVQNTIKNPDEVWYYENDGGKFKSRYLKFSQDEVIVVETEMSNKGSEISTWYLMKVNESSLRKGLKIK